MQSGDQLFREKLPEHLESLGIKILDEIRGLFAGDLEYYDISKRFVNRPDNFFAIKPQPRDESFRFSVRGYTETLFTPSTFDLKDDQAGYSTFKINKPLQIQDLLSVLKSIPKK